MTFSESDQIKFYKDKITHFSAGGFVFFKSKKNNKLYVALLVKKDGSVMIPKGHIKKNEETKDAALREIKEELMLTESPALVTELEADDYSFYLSGDKREHYKKVYLYVFSVREKVGITPLEKEDFIQAKWFEFSEALDNITFDRVNLLKARQTYYFQKPIKTYQNLSDVQSIVLAIPIHNGAKTIISTLNSVITSASFLPRSIDHNIIICLDHCNDNSESLINDFIFNNKINNIIVLHNTDVKGKSTTLNHIIGNSSSELICVIDDDVILNKYCLPNLVKELVKDKDLRCVFAKWKRADYLNKNIWRNFWHWILGIKFDIQPYDRPSEIMRGSCLMLRRNNYVYIPAEIYNEDQFLQYTYWPKTREIQDAILYFNSVTSLTDYYKRFIRITVGTNQLRKEFTEQRIKECDRDLYRKIDYKKILNLPMNQKFPFLLYRFVRLFVNLIVRTRLTLNKNYEWFRIKQP